MLSVSGSLCTGEGASNVIPDSVSMAGTLRALTNIHFEHLRSRITQVILSNLLCCASACENALGEQSMRDTVR